MLSFRFKVALFLSLFVVLNPFYLIGQICPTVLADSLLIETPVIELTRIDRLKILGEGKNSSLLIQSDNLSGKGAKIVINRKDTVSLYFADGLACMPFEYSDGQLISFKTLKGQYHVYHFSKNSAGQTRFVRIPLWLSLFPPLIAILLALIFREVIVSLFMGILTGAFITNGLQFDFYSILSTILATIDKYILQTLVEYSHMQIIVFSLLIGGMVGIISRNGGMAGVVLKLTKYATTPRSAQLITWLLGVAIFFDDYTNTLIVGNTMRATTDRFKISREKLAYIVDSTAAPIAALALITTWIGYELGQIEAGLQSISGLEELPGTYSVFLQSLKYSFYPVFTLIFILFIIFMNRDFGPMLKAETRARTTGKVAPPQDTLTEEGDMEELVPVKGAPLRWFNAVFPILVVIFVTLYGLIATGMESCQSKLGINVHSWSQVWNNLDSLGQHSKISILLSNADAYQALIWASFSGIFTAVLLTLSQRIMKIEDTMSTMLAGFKAMLPAILILVFAWSLATITKELYTAEYLSDLLQGQISPFVLPPVVFILAAFIAFSTGSSWSTMAILYPIAIPLTYTICTNAGIDTASLWEIMYNVIATVLAASVVGDHCSPISDTTILSSLATDCNHIDHVRTQLPYALVVGLVSIIIGYVATLLSIPYLLNLGIGTATLFFIIKFFGKKVPEDGNLV